MKFFLNLWASIEYYGGVLLIFGVILYAIYKILF